MFLTKCCRGLTMHQFESPPAVVLDLGCGSGYWALEAAKQWPVSARLTLICLCSILIPPLSGKHDHRIRH